MADIKGSTNGVGFWMQESFTGNQRPPARTTATLDSEDEEEEDDEPDFR